MPTLVASVALAGTIVLGVAIGPVGLSPQTIGEALLAHLPWLHLHPHVSPVESAIVWDLRLPRVLLAGIVGAMLAASGTAYQGVLRNPLADPYLLGAAAGAGLGATGVIITGHDGSVILPIAAFAGAVAAVVLTYALANPGSADDGGPRILLAGVAVAALLTAVQTYLQQQHIEDIRQIYSWILGSFGAASWTSVGLILPYAVVSAGVLLAFRRVLDVLRVGHDEAAGLGVDPVRARLVVVAAATLGTAAAVSVSGLIGFVGIIVPHAVRLAAHSSYRVLMPVAMVAGAAFMILVDLLARTVQAPSEVPVGVVTALVGAPFFLLVLRLTRHQGGVL
jgi:iron complex transport system permease protein